MSKEEIAWLSAVEMAEAVRKKKLSPVEILEAVLSRVEQVNPKINAIVTLDREGAMQRAREAEREVMAGEELGPLHGVPVTLKDLTPTKGMRTTFGSRLYEDYVPAEDAVYVERLRRAGAIIVGKTNTPEFGLIGNTDNVVFGLTQNPWKEGRSAGGSSGGAAASAASGLGPLHQGDDGGGSVRLPASFNGVFGIKPQHGRVPRRPTLRGWETLAAVGPITRSVSDAALMLEVMAGPHGRDRHAIQRTPPPYPEALEPKIKGLKVAWSPDLGGNPVEPEVRELTEQAVRTLADLGATVEEENTGWINVQEDWLAIVLSETAASLGPDMERWEKVMYPAYGPLVGAAQGFSGVDFARALFRREELWERTSLLFETYDLLALPTAPCTAFPAKLVGPERIAGKSVPLTALAAFTIPFNMTGQPAASLPCGFDSEGLPVGLQLVGRRFDEHTVLKAASALESARPWANRRPPL